MRQLLRKLRYLPKSAGVTAALCAALLIPAALLAYGPARDSYTAEKPATIVTLNSVTNSPSYGNEFNFVTVKDAANSASGGWQDTVSVKAGRDYLVRIYVDNNAAASLKRVATGTKVKANVPGTTGTSATINGFVSATNAEPTQVWDQVILKSTTPFKASYVSGSAKLYNNAHKSGISLPDSIATSAGALVGYSSMDGKVPGGFAYASTIIFKVRVTGQSQPSTQPPAPASHASSSFAVEKTVRAHGAETAFRESVSVKPGDKVDFRIYFKNTGETQLKNVAVKDTLPAGLRYIAGTTRLNNSGGSRIVADGVASTGIVIGGYQPDGNAYVTFTAQVADNAALPRCGSNSLKNTASVMTASDTKTDSAIVTTARTCVKPEASTTEYACRQLDAVKISRNTFEFRTTATKSETVIPETVRITYGDGASDTIPFGTSPIHTYGAPGRYSAVAYVTFSVNGKTVPNITHTACKVKVTVEQTAVTAAAADRTTSSTSGSSRTATATRAQTQTQTTTRTDQTPTSTDVTEQETPVTTTSRVRSGTTVAATTTPATTTTSVPSTGPEQIAGGLVGSSALGLGIHSWLSSRRTLRAAARR